MYDNNLFHSRRYRFVNRWRVLLGSIYNKPVNANVAEVKAIVYHSSYLPFVDPNIDDNSRDIAVLALTHPLTFNGRTHKHTLMMSEITDEEHEGGETLLCKNFSFSITSQVPNRVLTHLLLCYVFL